jgi:hypothetical protein
MERRRRRRKEEREKGSPWPIRTLGLAEAK